MVETESSLSDLLQKMIDEIANPACCYWVYTNYFDVQLPTDRAVTRWYQAPLFLNHDAIWNAQFTEDGMLCDVILKNQLPAQRERIKVEYEQIYRITRFVEGKPTTEKESILYTDSSKLIMPPL